MISWRSELNRLLIILLIALLVGLLLQRPSLAMLAALIYYCGHNLIQLRKLALWANSQRQTSAPPESSGIWGGIFDSFYRLQRQERLASDYLKSIINT